MTSIIIPSRNEPYLHKTVNDLLGKAKHQIEIIVVLDGYWPDAKEISTDPRVHYIHFSKPRGMRNAINSAVAVSKGEWILKVDAHCMFDEHYDEKLIQNCRDNWVVIPRRKRLDPENWELTEMNKPDIDYMYLAHPDDPTVWGGRGLQGKEWREMNLNTNAFPKIDDLMTFQGSCWFMKKSYYEFLELMDEENYGEFAKEAQEIGLKAWLSGGRVLVNKLTWYAHWHKPKSHGRGYSLSGEQFDKGTAYTNLWLEDKAWHKQTLPFKTLIEKFNPPGWEGKI